MKKIKIICVGLFTGLISGLFSSGGGLILLPALIYILKMDEREARATTVICIVPLVITAFLIYYKNNLINWKLGILAAIGGVIGGIIGSKILTKIPIKFLKILMIILLAYSSFRILI